MPVLRRPVALLAALAICGSLGGCIFSYERATVPASSSVAMPMATPVGIDAKTAKGRIVITQNPAATEATVSAEAKLQTQDRADRFTIDTRLQGDGTLVVRPVWPDGERLKGENCQIEITAPALHDILARTSNGSITLAGGTGDAQLKTSNGAVRVQDRQGEVYVRTSNGAIELTRCVGVFDVDTSNGAVKISGSPPSSGETFAWRVSTSNGSITLDLDQPLDAQVRASTSNGKSKLQRTGGGETSTMVSGRTIQTGDGPSEVTLRTSNGSITIRTP